MARDTPGSPMSRPRELVGGVGGAATTLTSSAYHTASTDPTALHGHALQQKILEVTYLLSLSHSHSLYLFLFLISPLSVHAPALVVVLSRRKEPREGGISFPLPVVFARFSSPRFSRLLAPRVTAILVCSVFFFFIFDRRIYIFLSINKAEDIPFSRASRSQSATLTSASVARYF